MPWNWELPNWPNFYFRSEVIVAQEKQFLLGMGGALASLKTLSDREHQQVMVEILSTEGEKSARIEGEILDRESLQSSIKRHFGIQDGREKKKPKEKGMAELVCNVYTSFQEKLTEDMFRNWHALLFGGSEGYRTHPEPMQIVSSRYGANRLFFEAPPSSRVRVEMERFIKWFNTSSQSESILGRAAIAHLYFENIHPFEDGNGRIGRALIEKVFSQGVGRPVLVAMSKTLEKRKKEYYAALERCNRSLNAEEWVEFFADAALEAEKESMRLISFLVEKSRLFTLLKDELNERQEKVMRRLFEEGPEGFQGGLSAENYVSITKVSRATATRDLADLVQKGALKKTGELRHTRYWLNINGVNG